MEAIVDDEYQLTLIFNGKESQFNIFICQPDKVQSEDWALFINCLRTDDQSAMTFDSDDGETVISTVKGKTSFIVSKASWRNKIKMNICLPNELVRDAIVTAFEKIYK